VQRSLIIALILIVLTVVFALQNANPVRIQLFFWEVDYPLAVIIPITLLFGALLGILFSLPAIMKRNDKLEALREQIRRKKEEDRSSQK
jgi:putative membrane protein